jgi:hypothetical protein
VEIDFTNYLQYAGVRPGKNRVTFRLERLGGAKVERFRIFGDSGIMATRRAPARLAIEPTLADDEVRVGDTFDVAYRLVNKGGRPAPGAAVWLEAPFDGLEIVDDPEHEFTRVVSAQRGVFLLRADRPGNHRLMFRAAGGANHPVATLDVSVLPAASSAQGWGPARLVVGSLLLLIGATLLVRDLARRRLAHAHRR